MSYKTKFYCIDCNKEISKPKYKRCNLCNKKYRTRHKKEHKCKDCGKELNNFYANYCHSCASKGIRNSNYKHGNNIKNKKCIDCGKVINIYSTRCQHCSGIFRRKPKNKCLNCKKIIRPQSKYCLKCFQLGSKNHCFIDGRSYELYPQEFNKTLKDSIRKRDNYECQNCGMTEEEHLIVMGRVLEVHHIDYDKKNCQEYNLITTCQQCNTRANHNRNYWQKIYQEKIQNILTKNGGIL